MRRLALIAALLLAALSRPAFAVTNGLSADYSKGVVLLGSPAGAANCNAGTTGAIRYNSVTFKVQSCKNGTGWTDVGGTVTPAGSDTQVQWNNNGTLAASSGLTFSSAKLALALGSITGAGAPVTAAGYLELNGNTSATLSAGATWYGAVSGMVTMVSGTDTSAITRNIVSRAATVQNLYYHASAANSAGKTNTITVMKNGSATTLTCYVSAATTCSDTSHSFTVSAGDEIGIRIATDTATNTAVRHSWSIELSY